MDVSVAVPMTRTRSAFFRTLNNDLVRLSRPARADVRLIVCECSKPQCAEALEVTNGEYDAVRAHETRFLVVPGHEIPGVQRVVTSTRHTAVVEEHRKDVSSTPAARNGNIEQNGRPAIVLLVDDDPAMRALCALSLRLDGLHVLEAADGYQGLKMAVRDRPALVVTDVSMPGLGGFGLGEALRSDERTRRIPLIFVSGESDIANATRARELGALAYVSKPCDPQKLSSVAAGVIARFASPTQTAMKD